ncbi:unnamed protein product [Nezara viridula]|nr:unnamed protein product [Nezara viridula]
MTLTGLRQEKYIQLFNKKGVTKFDTFVNMTEEDLLYVGITDDDDRKKILEGIEPLKQLYKDVNEFGPPDLNMVIGNNIHHIRTLFGSLIILRRELLRRKPKNILIDSTHSSVNAINTLLERLKDQLDYIENDITIKEVVKPNSKTRKFLCFGLIASSCTAIGAIAVSKYLGYSLFETLKHLKFPDFFKLK